MKIVYRPYQDQDAEAFAAAVNQSLDTLTPWLACAIQPVRTITAQLVTGYAAASSARE
ncbi:hypothetical protein ACFFJN_05075 [Erwinia mallotivora]|uniref:hypothetical protein n=1 Tax=Erwinia mallotivora TaxID=69222 RepID=UPI0035EDD102